VASALDRFTRRAGRLDPEAFAAAYAGLLSDVQHDL